MRVRLWACVCALAGVGARAGGRACTRLRVRMCLRDRLHVRACVRTRVLTRV